MFERDTPINVLTKHCKGCVYFSDSTKTCDYLIMTEQRRPCPLEYVAQQRSSTATTGPARANLTGMICCGRSTRPGRTTERFPRQKEV